MNCTAGSRENKSLSTALEKNERDLFACLGQKSKNILGEESDIKWIIARPSWPNFLYDPSFDGANVVQRIAEIGEQIERGFIPPVVKVGPDARPTSLGQLLANEGFKKLEISRPGMAIDLDTIAKAPSELKTLGISPIINRSDLREWMAVIAGENWFFEEDYLTAAMVDSGLTMYIGRWEGKAISVAMLFVNAGVAGIYLVNVLSNYWRRGVGRAMTHRLLTDARDLGCSTAVLQASDMGRSLYEKMGFCQICEIEYYSWHNITFNQFMEA